MDVVRPELARKKRLRQRITWMAIALAAVGAVASVVSLGAATPSLDRSDVLIETVRRGEFVRMVRGPGKLVPSHSRWVIARTDAIVERIRVQPGMPVKAGTTILELSNPDVQDRLLAAEAAFAAATADHAALRAQMTASQLEIESSLADVKGRYLALQVEEEASRLGLEKGVLSAVHYKQIAIQTQQLRERTRIEDKRAAQAALNMRAQVASSQARLDQLARTRDLRRVETEALEVKAGLDGVVQQVSVEEGQRVNAGINLARVARPSTLMAELRIAESQASEIIAGQQAVVEIGRARVRANVRRVNPMVEKGTILVEVALLGALPEGARTEQSVDGSIIIDSLPNALFVGRPVNAQPGSQIAVFRLSGTENAERVSVRFGKDSANQIQVLSGLKEGDRIIVSDMGAYSQAAEVSID